MKKYLYQAVALLLFVVGVCGQADSVKYAREYRIANEHRLLRDFVEFLSIPNVASDTANIYRNADYLVSIMRRSGLRPRLLAAKDKSVPPAVYGEWTTPGAKQTIILYAHYDGQ